MSTCWVTAAAQKEIGRGQKQRIRPHLVRLVGVLKAAAAVGKADFVKILPMESRQWPVAVAGPEVFLAEYCEVT